MSHLIHAIFTAIAAVGLALPAHAQETTWRADILPLVKANCTECHGADTREYGEWMLLGDAKRKKEGPRMDTYGSFMNYVTWPATGAMQRRLDDGKATGGKPGNMYKYLGADDAERAKNLQTLKAWLGEGAWNLNRFMASGDVPGVTKAQLEKVKAKY